MCTVLVSARHHGDRSMGEIEQDDYSINSDDSEHKHNHAKDRHRRKRFQPYHSYHSAPHNPFYYPERREDSPDLVRIIRLLEDIAHHVRQPQLPPPQIVYVPYIPYGFPQNCNCPNTSGNSEPAVPTFDNRMKPPYEENQNWGFVEKSGKDDSSNDDFSRPISFTPAQRPNNFKRPQPKVDHGSTQAGVN